MHITVKYPLFQNFFGKFLEKSFFQTEGLDSIPGFYPVWILKDYLLLRRIRKILLSSEVDKGVNPLTKVKRRIFR